MIKIIDLDKIQKAYKTTNGAYAVIKADAYGLGYLCVAKALYEAGCRRFALLNVQEGLALKKWKPDVYVLILGPLKAHERTICEENKIVMTVYDNSYGELEINTGMNRFGINVNDLFLIDKDKLSGVYTHISSLESFESQMMLFNFSHENMHVGGSAYLGKHHFRNRVGLMLYEKSMSVYSNIIFHQWVKKGSYVGYEIKAYKDMLVGIVDIGYNEGLDKSNIGRFVYQSGHFLKIVSICMNHTLIELDKIRDGEVEIIGEHITLDYLSYCLKKSKYEIFIGYRNIGKKYVKTNYMV